MKHKQKRALVLATFLPALTLGAYALMATPQVEACSAIECAYNSACYSVGGCNQNTCDSPTFQECMMTMQGPTYAPQWSSCISVCE